MNSKASLEYMDNANCKNDDYAANMLASEEPGTRKEASIIYCKSCPVRTECLGDALDRNDYNKIIYGGLDGTQRWALLPNKKNLAIIAFKQYKK